MSSVADYFRYRKSPNTHIDIFMIEEIYDDDERAHHREMKQSKCKEIHVLLRGETFSTVLRREVPADANDISGRFALAIKSKLDRKTKDKARLVVGGHCDKLKDLMMHSSETLQPLSIRYLQNVSVLFEINFRTTDETSAQL